MKARFLSDPNFRGIQYCGRCLLRTTYSEVQLSHTACPPLLTKAVDEIPQCRWYYTTALAHVVTIRYNSSIECKITKEQPNWVDK